MSRTPLLVWLLLGLAALLVPPAGAADGRKPVSGKLSKRGYTVIAVAAGDRASSLRVDRYRFSLTPPAKLVTLHLRAPSGRYAGPIVIGRKDKGTVAILGVRAGARLGRINVGKGYAKLAKPLGKYWVATSRRARARKGVPIGAGRFGRVRSLRVRTPAPGDLDLDGIPDVLDVDDDGDRILDSLDRSNRPRSARAAADPERLDFFFSSLDLGLDQTVNAHAGSAFDIDTALSQHGDLVLDVLPGDPSPDSPELDCGGSIQDPPRPEGLIYCRPHASGGVGMLFPGPGLADLPFPDCCDADGDGLGTLRRSSGTPPPGVPRMGMRLHHRATSSGIGTGDVMIQHVTIDGTERSYLGILQYVFATVPALASYAGETGSTVTIPYPYPDATDPDGPGPSITRPEPLPVADGDADGDVEVTLNFWRPQRRGVAEFGEDPASWVDFRNLWYEVQVEHSGRRCPQTAFSESDPNLAPNSSSPGSWEPGVTDDNAPDPDGEAFTFTLNLTQCLTANGFSFNPGEERGISIVAHNGGNDNAQQAIWFKRN